MAMNVALWMGFLGETGSLKAEPLPFINRATTLPGFSELPKGLAFMRDDTRRPWF
jgi:hypothetical protein